MTPGKADFNQIVERITAEITAFRKAGRTPDCVIVTAEDDATIRAGIAAPPYGDGQPIVGPVWFGTLPMRLGRRTFVFESERPKTGKRGGA